MDIVLRLLTLFGGVVVGVAFIRYSFQLTQIFGHNEYAERFIGSGGTYTMWKILGVIVAFASAWWGLR